MDGVTADKGFHSANNVEYILFAACVWICVCTVVVVVVVHYVFFFLNVGSIFWNVVGAFCLVISLPLSKEDAFY